MALALVNGRIVTANPTPPGRGNPSGPNVDPDSPPDGWFATQGRDGQTYWINADTGVWANPATGWTADGSPFPAGGVPQSAAPTLPGVNPVASPSPSSSPVPTATPSPVPTATPVPAGSVGAGAAPAGGSTGTVVPVGSIPSVSSGPIGPSDPLGPRPAGATYDGNGHWILDPTDPNRYHDNGNGTATDLQTGKNYPYKPGTTAVIGLDGTTVITPAKPATIGTTPIGGNLPAPRIPPQPNTAAVNTTVVPVPGSVDAATIAHQKAQDDQAKQNAADQLKQQIAQLAQQGRTADAQLAYQKGVALGYFTNADGTTSQTLADVIDRGNLANSTALANSQIATAAGNLANSTAQTFGHDANGNLTFTAQDALGRIGGQSTLARETQEAASRRADEETNLKRQGQSFDQWMKQRNDTEALSQHPQDWLSYAFRSGGQQAPTGVGLWDQLNTIDRQQPQTVDQFLSSPAGGGPAAPVTAPAAAAGPDHTHDPATGATVPVPAPAPSSPAAVPVAMLGGGLPKVEMGGIGPLAGTVGAAIAGNNAPASAAVAPPPQASMQPAPAGGNGTAAMNTPQGHTPGFSAGATLPLYDMGGVVPGAPGDHQAAILEAGERVTPPPAGYNNGVVQNNVMGAATPGEAAGGAPAPAGQPNTLHAWGNPNANAVPQGSPQQTGMWIDRNFNGPPGMGDHTHDAVTGAAVPVQALAAAGSNGYQNGVVQGNTFGRPTTGETAGGTGVVNNAAPPVVASNAQTGSGLPGQVPSGAAHYLPNVQDFLNAPFTPPRLKAALTPGSYSGYGVSPYAIRSQGGYRPLSPQVVRALTPNDLQGLQPVINQTGNWWGDAPWQR